MHEPCSPGCNFSAHATRLHIHLAHTVLLGTPKNVQQMSKWAEKHEDPGEHVGVGCAALLGAVGHVSGSPGPASHLGLAFLQSVTREDTGTVTEDRQVTLLLKSSQAQSIAQTSFI